MSSRLALVCLLGLQCLHSTLVAQTAGDLPTVPGGLRFDPPKPVLRTAQNQPPEPLQIPLSSGQLPANQLDIRSADQRVSIFAQDVDLRLVLAHLAEESQINIVVAESVQGKVNTTLTNVPLWEALDAILKINGLVWTRQENIIFVNRPGNGEAQQPQTANAPGQIVQVFDLNYTSAKEVQEVVNGLLSPGGKAFVHAVNLESTRQTRERIVVEDFPDRMQAISMYLASVDNPPRQVLIEAHVMQVTLTNDQRHGVNLLGIARVAGARVNVQAQGFANGAASPGFMMGLEGTDLNGMIEALRSKSEVETLAAPKVLVVNGQQARIQIGSKFGYFVTTTTQTSTLQSVNFLDIGVVLQVQPTITRDNQVLLTVEPKVSGGRINPDSGLPEEDTTEANTTVLLPDGKGMIIGGLIKESDDHRSKWIPWLGEQPVIGKLFSRSNDDVQRIEVIIALTPHIVPISGMTQYREATDYARATSSTSYGQSASALPMDAATFEWSSAPTMTSAEITNGQEILVPNSNPAAWPAPSQHIPTAPFSQ